MCVSEGKEGSKARVRSLDSGERVIVGIETLLKAKNLTHKFRTLTLVSTEQCLYSSTTSVRGLDGVWVCSGGDRNAVCLTIVMWELLV